MQGLIGYKIGMTRIFSENNISVPITVIKIEENRVTQIKFHNDHGYDAIQVTTGQKKNNKINKPQLGHFNKVNVAVGNGLWEWRLKNNEHKFSIGQKITIKSLLNIKKVDISGISKGKGFAGTIKRWNFHRQDTTHGNSLSHRAPGSIGQNQTPGRVLKGKKMAGQLGNHHITIQNLHVVDLDITNELLLIKGSVPGIKGTYLIIKPAIKQSSH